MPKHSSGELRAWINFVDTLRSTLIVPSSLPICDPASFISLAFESERPEFAVLLTTAERIHINRRRWKSRYGPASTKKLGQLKAERKRLVALSQEFGIWGEPSTWESWESFFKVMRADARFSNFYYALTPLRKLTRQLAKIEPPQPRYGHLHVEQYFRAVISKVRRQRDVACLLNLRTLRGLANPDLNIKARFQLLSRIKRVDLPMLQLGCLAASFHSRKWRKLSRLKAPFPLMAGLMMAARHPDPGVFWQNWIQWAFGQSGAKSKRGWARMIDRSLADQSKWGEQSTVNLVQGWMKGSNREPTRDRLESAFRGWAASTALSDADLFPALIEWRLLYLLTFNLELTLTQWRRNDQMDDEEIKAAFAQGAKTARFFGRRIS